MFVLQFKLWRLSDKGRGITGNSFLFYRAWRKKTLKPKRVTHNIRSVLTFLDRNALRESSRESPCILIVRILEAIDQFHYVDSIFWTDKIGNKRSSNVCRKKVFSVHRPRRVNMVEWKKQNVNSSYRAARRRNIFFVTRTPKGRIISTESTYVRRDRWRIASAPYTHRNNKNRRD